MGRRLCPPLRIKAQTHIAQRCDVEVKALALQRRLISRSDVMSKLKWRKLRV
jgi:hypothetical protein